MNTKQETTLITIGSHKLNANDLIRSLRKQATISRIVQETLIDKVLEKTTLTKDETDKLLADYRKINQ